MPTLNLTPTQAQIAYELAKAQQERYQAAYNELAPGDHGKRQIAAWLDEARGLADKLSRLVQDIRDSRKPYAARATDSGLTCDGGD